MLHLPFSDLPLQKCPTQTYIVTEMFWNSSRATATDFNSLGVPFGLLPIPTLQVSVACNSQARKRYIKIRKVLGTPAECPRDTRQDKQGSTSRCPRGFLLFTMEELAFLPGHRLGVFQGPPASRGRFSEMYAFFLICLFCSLNSAVHFWGF